jgi:hypothetical protein
MLDSMNEAAPTTAMSDGKRQLNIGRVALQLADILFYTTTAGLVLKTTNALGIVRFDLWLEGLFVITATVSIVLAMSQVVPFQNVALAAIVIGFVGSLAHITTFLFPAWLDESPFGDVPRPLFRGYFLWRIPLAWVVTVLASRGTAQFLLSQRRNTSRYGLELMACTTVLSLILICATQAFNEWVNGSEPGHFELYTRYWFSDRAWTLFAWVVVTLVAVLAATPALIDKKPGNRPPGFRPLLLWSALLIVCAAAAMRLRMWPESALISAVTIAVPVFAMYKRSRSEP